MTQDEIEVLRLRIIEKKTIKQIALELNLSWNKANKLLRMATRNSERRVRNMRVCSCMRERPNIEEQEMFL